MHNVHLYVAHSDPNRDKTSIPINRPNVLANRSLGFRERIEQARNGEEQVVVTTSDDDDYIETLTFVIGQLSDDAVEADVGGRTTHVNGTFQTCNVLWEYKCLPSNFEGMAETVQPRSSAASTAGGPPRYCWHVKQLGDGRASIGSQLMTIFLVLGRQDAFKTELIATACRSKLEGFDTPVQKLADIKALRLEQLRALFDALREAHIELIEEDEDTAQYIRTRLKAAKLGQLTAKSWDKNLADNPQLSEKNPYLYMLDVEEVLIPDDTNDTDEEKSTGQNSERQRDPRNLPPVDARSLFSRMRRNTIDRILPASPTRGDRAKHIREFLKRADKAMKEAQDEQVKRLMEWRNGEVENWRLMLQGANRENP